GPVVLLLQYENFLSYMMPGDLQTAMLDALRPSISNDMFVTTGLAVLLAITGFAYLFSKKKVDLYHSIPVKREKLFMASYLSGILIYLGMYAVKTAAVIMVAAGRGFFTKEAGMVYLHTVLGNVIHFLLIYHVIIIAVMLTGNLLVSIAASGVLLLYGFIISQVLRELSSMYFCTY
ncbi:MAG TPA: hypothetical protein PLU43_07765, partial [Lachnospiraceae bacterium]|nr:hypothetical protein [Lachnospiraceae bacterium]